MPALKKKKRYGRARTVGDPPANGHPAGSDTPEATELEAYQNQVIFFPPTNESMNGFLRFFFARKTVMLSFVGEIMWAIDKAIPISFFQQKKS